MGLDSSLITTVDTSDTLKSIAIKTVASTAGAVAACYVLNKAGAGAGTLIARNLPSQFPIGNIPLSGKALTAAPIIMNWGYQVGSSLYRKGSLELTDLTPKTGSSTVDMVLETGLSLGVKAARTYAEYRRDNRSTSSHSDESRVLLATNLNALQEGDHAVDEFLESLFALVFKETDVNYDPLDKRNKVEELPLPESISPIERERRIRINKSIQTYYAHADRNRPVYQLTNPEGLTPLFISLQLFHYTLTHLIKTEITHLEQTVGKPFKSIVKSLDADSSLPFGEYSYLKPEHASLIQAAVTRIHLKQSRLEQIKHLLELSDDLLKCSNERDPQKYYKLLELLAIGLKTKTAYRLGGPTPRLNHFEAQFEASTGFKLWQRQVSNLEKAVEGDVILDLPPGDGKTAAIIPLTIAQISNGDYLPIIIFPKQLAGSNMPTVNQQLNRIFHKSSYALEFNRGMVLNPQKLVALIAMFNGTMIAGEAIQMTKEDAQAIRSIFVEHLNIYRKKPSAEKKETLILLHMILSKIFTKGVAIADEAHETYAHRKQLNYPLGLPKRLKIDYCRIMEAVLREVTRCKELFDFLKNNKGYTLNRKTYDEIYKKQIAEALSFHPLLKIQGTTAEETAILKREFIGFICDTLPTVPLWISKNKKLYQKVSLIKGVLNDLLPMNFKNRAGVNYGRRKDDTTDFSRPSDGNNGASAHDSIKNPYETYIKTNLMLFVEGLNSHQFDKLVTLLSQTAQKEMKVFDIPYEETKVAIRFGKYFTNEFLIENKRDDFSTVYHELNQDPDICMLYTRHFIRPQIKFWKFNIENNSHDFASMFHQQISCTGTPYNDGTYPTWLKMLPDDGTMGELLHIIQQRCPKDHIHVIEGHDPLSSLSEIIHAFLPPGAPFSAIIDGGALFTGISNYEVARQILTYCKRNRPEIKAVKFYMEDTNGKDQLFCLTPNHQDPILASNLHIKPAECITYYDQRHGFGADVKQEGDGLETLGPNHPLFKWLQEIFRIRGLKKEFRLEAWEGLNFQQQNIQIVMLKALQNIIFGNDTLSYKAPTLYEIIEYVIRNEAALAEDENFPSMISKIKHVPVKTVYKKIMTTPSHDFENWFGTFTDHDSLFIQKVLDDPIQLFGHSKSLTPVKDALKKASQATLRNLKKKSGLNKEDIDEIKNELRNLRKPERLPPLPLFVQIPVTADNHLHFDSMIALGLEQTAQITAEQAAEQEIDQEMDQEMNLNVAAETHSLNPEDNSSAYYKELPWPKVENPASLDILQFKTDGQYERYLMPIQSFCCPLYQFNTILAASDLPPLNFLSNHIDDRIWVSNNFLPRTVTGLFQKPVEPVSPYQRHLAQTLVHFKINTEGKAEILYVGALSLKDGVFWKKNLPSSPVYWDQQEIKVVLWQANLGHIHAGNIEYENLLTKNEDFNTLLLQLKILDGQFRFPKQKSLLKKWLKNRASFKLLESFVHVGMSRQSQFSGSQLHRICLKTIPGYYIEDEL